MECVYVKGLSLTYVRRTFYFRRVYTRANIADMTDSRYSSVLCYTDSTILWQYLRCYMYMCYTVALY